MTERLGPGGGAAPVRPRGDERDLPRSPGGHRLALPEAGLTVRARAGGAA